MNVPVSAAETSRLEALAGCNIDFDCNDSRFDLITRLAANCCHAPVAFISFVDADTVRLKSSVGIGLRSFARAHSFCTHAITTPEVIMVVGDARYDRRFDRHALVNGDLQLWSYAGAPLLDARGHAVGVLAVLDYVPRGYSDSQLQMLAALAKEVEAFMELCETVQRLENELSEHLRYERRLEATQRELRQVSGTFRQLAA
jgi:GAF domain-containing protein